MVKQCIGAIALVLSLGGCASGGPTIDDLTKSAGGLIAGGGGDLTNSDITMGLKEALVKGSSAVVGQLGQQNGFSKWPKIILNLQNGPLWIKMNFQNFKIGPN